ncbi:347_t:CDS:2 [Ambispora gerdemannii]|uniref:347_t:CDS:1 n=1 Tax=Ambispora gerdemannii TaxID=144530 RepID=A0A9N9AIF9_9GLOM|nr:347_t:CDS:2 [Ambispora gerdemannii]
MEITNRNKRFERVILNVGGIKYETYRNTLTAYPDTLLGTMFQERNQQILHPIDKENNEYFFDRNGRAFHYIMEFYRTGQLIWEDNSITLHRTRLLPDSNIRPNSQTTNTRRRREGPRRIHGNDETTNLRMRPNISSLQSLIAPFRYNGSAITHRYGTVIQNNLIEEFPGLNCAITHENLGTNDNEVWIYLWKISAPVAFSQNEIIEKSMLKDLDVDLI